MSYLVYWVLVGGWCTAGDGSLVKQARTSELRLTLPSSLKNPSSAARYVTQRSCDTLPDILPGLKISLARTRYPYGASSPFVVQYVQH